jgi:hypothetical protein
MYKDELYKIWVTQQLYFDLPNEFISEIEKIIFFEISVDVAECYINWKK